MKKNQKGITLVALIITVIVILILAAVTLSTLGGDNGIISKTQHAANAWDEEAKAENESTANFLSNVNNKNSENYLVLVATKVTKNSITVEIRGNNLTEYKFVIGQGSYTEITGFEDSATNIKEFSGLAENTQYTIVVKAKNANNEIIQDYLKVRTKGTGTDIPENDTVSPNIPTIIADTVNVKSSHVFSLQTNGDNVGGSGIKELQYSLTGATVSSWRKYIGQVSITLEGTTTISAKAIDNAGNESDVAIATVKIDKTAPDIASILLSVSTTNWTNSNVVVTATFPADSATKQVKIDGGSWTTYTGALSMVANGTVYVRAADTAGNWSGEKSITISCIDVAAPATPTIVADTINEKSSHSVVITPGADSGGSGIKEVQYSLSGATTLAFTKYTGTITINAEGSTTITAKTIDNAGNVSGQTSETVKVNGTVAGGGGTTSLIANAPKITTGMTPIKWVNGVLTDTTASDPDWYSYVVQNSTTETGGTSNWANIRLADGSMFVWVPRYAYRIMSGEHTSVPGPIDIIFLSGTEYKDSMGIAMPYGYNLHPAFYFGNQQLTGIWVGKFESSHNDATSGAEGTGTKIKIAPTVRSWKSIQVSDIFTACRNMTTTNWATYGFSAANTADTHMMKNLEWGAVAYLAHSKYGRNGTEVTINNNSSYITGIAGNSVSEVGTANVANTYNTALGGLASTTGNVYGVYDMSGGAYEYVAAYVNNGNTNLATYSATLVAAADKYKDVYAVGTTDTQATNYEANSSKKGDAVYETSSSGTSTTAWNTDYSSFPNTSNPVFIRGMHYGYGASAGVFAFINYPGYASSTYGFRVSLSL